IQHDGKAINIAARLHQLAAPGEVVISEATGRLLGQRYDLSPPQEVALKGFTAPLRICTVRSENPRSAGAAPRAIVGRARELAFLESHWAEVTGGGSSCIAIVGRPGIGKSCLLAAFRERLQGRAHAWHEFACHDHSRGSAFAPFAELLAGFRPEAVDPAARKAAVFNFLRSRILPTDSLPHVLVVEDIHWADASTLEWLDLLLRRHEARLLILVTQRPGDDLRIFSGQPVSRLALKELPLELAIELAKSIDRDERLNAEQIEAIVSACGGLPLFLEECVKASCERPGAAIGEIPDSLRDPISARLDQLGQAKRMLQMAAVLGRVFSKPVLGRMIALAANDDRARLPAIDEALETLVEKEILRHTGSDASPSYEFRHSLVRDAAYGSSPRSRRRSYHRIAALALEAVEAEVPHEEIAAHFDQAQEPGKSFRHWLQAGETALRVWAVDEAEAHLRAALAAVRALPASAERLHLEIDCRDRLNVALVGKHGWASPQLEENLRAELLLCERGGDGALRSALQTRRGLFNLGLLRGDLGIARENKAHVEALAKRLGDDASAAVTERIDGVFAFFLQGDFREASRRLASSIDLERRREGPPPVGLFQTDGLAITLSLLAWCRWFLGEAEASEDESLRAVERAKAVDHAFTKAYTLCLTGSAWLCMERFADTIANAEAALSISEDCGFKYWAAYGQILLGVARARSGWEQDIALAMAGLEECARTGTQLLLPFATASVAEALLNAGRLDEAASLLESLNITDVRFYSAEVLRLRALLAWRQGQAATARALAQEALACARLQSARPLEERATRLLAAVEPS
ncbi:MAG TPA: AAA family ATPase, partial [Kiloniellales bacterium]|nr:AAA family ATPase [Kiloniellales bacterium]